MSFTPEQLAFRRTGLTATDMVVLAGESPYGDTVFDVYAEKCLPNPAPRPSTEAMEWGTLIEPLIVKRVAEEEDIAIVYPCSTMRSKETEWALATLDARIVEWEEYLCSVIGHENELFIQSAAPKAIGLVECKVVGARMMHLWPEPGEGIMPPDHVVVQATWQMRVSGVRKAIVAALLGTEMRRYYLDYNEALSDDLYRIGERFWFDHVVPRIPPEVDGSDSSIDFMGRMWPSNNGTLAEATAEEEELMRLFDGLRSAEKHAETSKKLAEAKLKELIQDRDGLNGASHYVTWKAQKNGTRVFRLKGKNK